MPKTAAPSTSVRDEDRARWKKRLATIATAAAYVDTSPKTIRRAISEGRITAYRFGPRLIRVDLNEIDASLKVIPSAGSAA